MKIVWFKTTFIFFFFFSLEFAQALPSIELIGDREFLARELVIGHFTRDNNRFGQRELWWAAEQVPLCEAINGLAEAKATVNNLASFVGEADKKIELNPTQRSSFLQAVGKILRIAIEVAIVTNHPSPQASKDFANRLASCHQSTSQAIKLVEFLNLVAACSPNFMSSEARCALAPTPFNRLAIDLRYAIQLETKHSYINEGMRVLTLAGVLSTLAFVGFSTLTEELTPALEIAGSISLMTATGITYYIKEKLKNNYLRLTGRFREILDRPEPQNGELSRLLLDYIEAKTDTVLLDLHSAIASCTRLLMPAQDNILYQQSKNFRILEKRTASRLVRSGK